MKTFATTKKRSSTGSLQRHVPAVPPAVSDWHTGRTAVRQILRGPASQAKLTIGAPDDVYEQEADRVADEVMRMPEPRLQMASTCNAVACPQVEEETIQTKPLVRSDHSTGSASSRGRRGEGTDTGQSPRWPQRLCFTTPARGRGEDCCKPKRSLAHTPQVTPNSGCGHCLDARRRTAIAGVGTSLLRAAIWLCL